MRSKLILALIAILCVLFINTTQDVAFATESNAKGMCVIEANSGRVIMEKNKDMKLAMASTTKIVTAITVLDNYTKDLDEKVVVPDEAVGIEGTSMYLKHNEQLTVRELLYGLMLPSGNDAATALAILTAGDEQSFGKLMKETAEKCGAVNTNFANAHGLDAEGHYTTAYDLALITAYALENPVFLDISMTKNKVIDATEQYDTRYLRNKNRLLLTMDNCIGVKTGFTDNAGRCFVAATEKEDGTKMVCVLLNSPPMFEEATRLLNIANENYSMEVLLENNKYLTSLPVTDGTKNFTRVYIKNGFAYPLTETEKNSVRIEYEYPKVLKAPIEKGQIVGNVKVFVGDDLIFTSEICTIDSVEELNVQGALDDILDKWM